MKFYCILQSIYLQTTITLRKIIDLSKFEGIIFFTKFLLYIKLEFYCKCVNYINFAYTYFLHCIDFI